MATNKERTSSAAMRKLLLQSASKKEQEIQQIGSVAESTLLRSMLYAIVWQ